MTWASWVVVAIVAAILGWWLVVPAVRDNFAGGGGGSGRDLDCSDFSGPVVIHDGNDPNGLDGDGDGVGCEANG